MVSKAVEEQVNRLESQVENGGGATWVYLCLVHKLKLCRPEKVLKYGLSLLNDSSKRSSLGPNEWTLYQQVAVAAMECQVLDHVAQDCIKVLQKRFPESKRVARLETVLLEAEKAYSSLLEDNSLGQTILKKRAAMAKGCNKEEKESSELQSLATTTLEKDYKMIAPEKIQLFLKTFSGKTIILELESSATIKDLKTNVYEKEGILRWLIPIAIALQAITGQRSFCLLALWGSSESPNKNGELSRIFKLLTTIKE